MKLVPSLLLLPLLVLGFFAPAQAQQARPQPIRAQLISSVESIKPGEPFWVGVLFNIDPTWHVYWKYPGPAGLPTKVLIKAPSNYELQTLEYPVPTTFAQPGNIPGYGYQDELLLFQKVEPPLHLEYGQAVVFEASARWLGCRDICVPGQAALKLELPIGDQLRPANQELFKSWQHRLPQKQFLPQILKLAVEGQRFRYALEWPASLKELAFYPDPEPGVRLNDIKVEPQGTTSGLSFDLSGSQIPKELRGLVSFLGPGATKRAVEVVLPLAGR